MSSVRKNQPAPEPASASVHNADIAAIFEQIADLLEIEGGNPFRVRAYRNGARSVQSYGRELRDLVAKGADLDAIPGIGNNLAAKIVEIVATGHCRTLEKLRTEIPPGLPELLKVPGLGPNRVRLLYQQLQIADLDQLYQAAHDGRLHELAGFGEKTEARILDALTAQTEQPQRWKIALAAQYGESLAHYLRTIPGVTEVTIAGSYRRGKETVGDLDILTCSDAGAAVTAQFVRYAQVGEILSQGPTRATVVLHSGLQVDLRVVPMQSYGAALHYFTGSRAHNIAIRRRGQQRQLKINEYGVFRGKKFVAGATESSVFEAVGLPWIPAELRENQGEIEAAAHGLLPELVTLGDLFGDLHAHTKATDGHDALEDMVLAARERGLTYLAITEHTRHLTVAHGLDPTRLLRQMEDIDRLNARLKGITVLKGVEVDILEDGSLDLPNEVLSRLDLVIGAIHSHFQLPRAKQTKRILKAMDQPHFTLLAHPSGRLLGKREPYALDMRRIIRHAKQRACFVEINAQPDRLDLTDLYARMAKDEGVLVAVNSDAHSVQDFDNLRFGITQARRGWLQKNDVLNTRPLGELRKLLQRTM